MALIKCPECGGMVSDAASACPHCGFPVSMIEQPEFGINLTIGDCINFGKYPQDIAGQEFPIMWYVIQHDANKALLLSKYCLSAKQYHKVEHEEVMWPQSYIREWLNNDFLIRAFGEMERNAIIETAVSESNIHRCPSYLCNDKVFLLSVDEANQYISPLDCGVEKAIPTEYAKREEELLAKRLLLWRFWLRSPGFIDSPPTDIYYFGGGDGSYYAADASGFKRFSYFEISTVTEYLGVRPAIWVNTDLIPPIVK